MQPFPSSLINSNAPVLTGEEWIIDALGCNPDSLTSLPVMRRLMDDVVHDLGLNVVAVPLTHQFPSPSGTSPGGVTLLYLLSESHLAAHTYPEHGIATLNLYCCCHREPWDWQTELSSRLSATRVEVKQIPRGDLSSRNVRDEGRR